MSATRPASPTVIATVHDYRRTPGSATDLGFGVVEVFDTTGDCVDRVGEMFKGRRISCRDIRRAVVGGIGVHLVPRRDIAGADLDLL